jgi:hypothetical protein
MIINILSHVNKWLLLQLLLVKIKIKKFYFNSSPLISIIIFKIKIISITNQNY